MIRACAPTSKQNRDTSLLHLSFRSKASVIHSCLHVIIPAFPFAFHIPRIPLCSHRPFPCALPTDPRPVPTCPPAYCEPDAATVFVSTCACPPCVSFANIFSYTASTNMYVPKMPDAVPNPGSILLIVRFSLCRSHGCARNA